MVEAKTTWGLGDYPLMAQALEPASRDAIELAGVSPGERVLDVATGTGNAALLAAARGAEVIGVDFEPALLRIAQDRARDAAAAITWLEGDLDALPIPDGWADVTVSVFGSMYAPDHSSAARELARTVRPDGRIVLASWIPGSLLPAMGAVLAEYLPPPPTASSAPSDWGQPELLTALLKDAGATLSATNLNHVTLDFADPAEAASFLIRTAGHVLNHQTKLAGAGRWESLHEDLAAFATSRGDESHGKLVLRLDYLVAVAHRSH